ncbi:MAG TPA: tetratricopeptide repeat protein [Terriglobia bacterium]|nr:tetratricopeptide repeat protein [Terriglobia bacterium]
MFRWRATLLAILHGGSSLILTSVQPAMKVSIPSLRFCSIGEIERHAAAQLGKLEGYAFREADGGPPMRALTVELIDRGKTRYRKTTKADGTFTFDRVREGGYRIQGRFGDFAVVEDEATVTGGGRNFVALMLVKRRAGPLALRTVTSDQLVAQSNRELERKQRQANKLAAQGDWAGAARLYEQAVAVGKQPLLWDALGLVYLQLGRKEEALNTFEKAIAQDPKYLLPYAHLETAYLESQRYKEMLAVANRALTIDPKWLTAYAYLGEAQLAMGNLNTALRSANTARELAGGKAPGPYLLLAKIQWARRDCAEARKLMDHYLELNTSARTRPEILDLLEGLQSCNSTP